MSSMDGFEAAALLFETRERLGDLLWADARGGRGYQRTDGGTTRLTITRDGQPDLVHVYEDVDLDSLT